MDTTCLAQVKVYINQPYQSVQQRPQSYLRRRKKQVMNIVLRAVHSKTILCVDDATPMALGGAWKQKHSIPLAT